MKALSTIIIYLAYSSALLAQSQGPCSDESHSQFDFWVGEWIVLDSMGTRVGENQISRIEGGCILLEHWTGAKGGTGTSLNYFDKADSTWNQVWVDHNGDVLKLKGRLVSGNMILRSALEKGNEDGYYNQITWSPECDGTVSQLWEIYDGEDRLINTAFLGIYHRKE